MAVSGQKTVTTHGTAEQLPDVRGSQFYIKALPGNTNTVWIGEDTGDVSSSNGFALDVGEMVVIEIENLSKMHVDSEVDGEGICWLRVKP